MSAPKSLIKSRENLQAICKNPDGILKYEVFDRILSVVWNNIRQSSLRPSSQVSLKYIIGLHDPSYHSNSGYRIVFTDAIILELIEILKKEYPGVDFTYRETARYDGTIIERIIVMDWS